MIFITDRSGEKDIKLHTTIKNNHGEELNLIEVFNSLFLSSNEVINEIILLIIKEILKRYGIPRKLDVAYHVGRSVFKIKDFIE